MKHYEFYRLVPGTDPVQIQEKIWKTFRKLDDELAWLNKPVIVRCCEGTGASFDLMASFELEKEEQVAEYQALPQVEKLRGKILEFVEDKATFDHY